MSFPVPLEERDFEFISKNLDIWWSGRNMSPMLPRLWFKDFSATSFVIRQADEPIAFLVGYISPTHPEKAYVHFIGVNPTHRNSGLGKNLYKTFGLKVSKLGATKIEAVTSTLNSQSLKFHESIGFIAIELDGHTTLPTSAMGIKDYDGAGEDRVLLRKELPFSWE